MVLEGTTSEMIQASPPPQSEESESRSDCEKANQMDI